MTEPTTTPHVFTAIIAVMAELAREGITKDRTNNTGGGFKFRGIDDVMNACAPLMAKHGLCVFPTYNNRQTTERSSSKGGTLFCVTLDGTFTFVSAQDGSRVTTTTIGEAFDSGDKATSKAMSVAMREALIKTFVIPTEGDNDADAHTHTVASALQNLQAGLQASDTAAQVKAVWERHKFALQKSGAAAFNAGKDEVKRALANVTRPTEQEIKERTGHPDARDMDEPHNPDA